MPAAIVASKYQVFVNTLSPTLTFVSTPAANNVLVVFISNEDNQTTNINTTGYTTIQSEFSGWTAARLAYKIANGTETGVQAGLFNTGSDCQMFYCEISGLDSITPLDASAKDATYTAGSSLTTTSGSATATAAAGIAIAAFATGDSWRARNPRSYTNSFTEIGSPVINDYEPGAFTAKLNYATTGAKSTTITISPTADELFGCIALFKEPAASGVTLAADSGSYSITGTAASLSASRYAALDSGAYSIVGQAASLLLSKLLTAEAGSYTITGTDALLTSAALVVADSGSYEITGTAAALLRSSVLAAESGSYAITGTDAGLFTLHKILADSGVYSITGTATGLVLARNLSADSGLYTVTGTPAVLTTDRLLAAVSGAYAIAGTDAALIYTPSGTYTLVVDSGAYSITGMDVGLLQPQKLVVDSGVYSITGSDVVFYIPANIARAILIGI